METAKLIEIVRKAIGGDDEARQELYMDSSKRVFFAANKILRDENDAEDIMHDVFITIFEKLADLREPAAYYKWANQVTANRCASFQRRKKAEPLEEQDLIDALEMEDVLVGTGAACSSKKRAMSAAFEAMGAPRWTAESAIRFSFGLMNTRDEAERAAEAVIRCYRRYGGAA